MAAHPAETPSVTRRPDSVWLLVAAVVLLLAYLLPRLSFYYHDTIYYTAIIQSGSWSDRLHPHHLGFPPLIWLLWTALQHWGFEFTPLDVMRPLGIGASLITLWAVGSALRQLGWGGGWVALLLLWLGCVWYLWLLSVTPTLYALTLCCLTLTWRELMQWPTLGMTRTSLRRASWWYTLALLWHQIAILAFPAILWAAWKCPREKADQVSWTTITGWLLGPIIGCYLLGGWIAQGNLHPASYLTWLTHYGHNPGNWWWGTLLSGERAVTYWWSLIVESHRQLFWAMPYESPAVLQANLEYVGGVAPLASWWWVEINPRLPQITGVLLGLLCLGLCCSIWWHGRQVGLARQYWRLALVWALPFVLFHTQYRPQDGWFRLYYLVPMVWVLMQPLLATSHLRFSRLGAAGLCGILLFTALNNYANGYVIWRYPEANRWLYAIPQLQALPEGWLVFGEPGYDITSVDYARTFVDRPVYQGEVVPPSMQDGADFGYTSPDLRPDRLYLDPLVTAAVETAPAGSLLHLSWKLYARPEPADVWIPVEALWRIGPVDSGIYQLTAYGH